MQTSTQDQEIFLQKIAVRQVSRGKGSAFFNLLFPFSLFFSFVTFFIMPLVLMQVITGHVNWLQTYLRWSPPLIVIVAWSLYSFLRHKRLKPVMEDLRKKQERGEPLY